ncbi:MAG: hypothetical protein GY940_26285 [bacterium]|nr:hypothetical protein [bacterium]
MKTEELIRLHREALERKAEADPFLNQRLKARIKDGSQRKRKLPGIQISLGRTVLLYGMLLILLTVANILVINGLKSRDRLPVHVNVQAKTIVVNTDTFASLQASYPGSISRAYAEVMK